MPKKKFLNEAVRERRAFVSILIIVTILLAGLTLIIFCYKPPTINDWGVKSGDWMRYCGNTKIINITSEETETNETWDDLYYTVIATTNLGALRNGSGDTSLEYIIGDEPNDPGGSIDNFPVTFFSFLPALIYASPPPAYLNMDQQMVVVKNWTNLILYAIFDEFMGLNIEWKWVNSLGECDESNETYLGYTQDYLVYMSGLHHLWREDFKIMIMEFAMLHLTFWIDDQTGICVKGQVLILIDTDMNGDFDMRYETQSHLCDFGTLAGTYLQFGLWIERYYFWIILTIVLFAFVLSIPILKKHIH